MCSSNGKFLQEYYKLQIKSWKECLTDKHNDRQGRLITEASILPTTRPIYNSNAPKTIFHW